MTRFSERLRNAKPLIGMIHLPPLPGYAGSPGIDAIVRHAVADLRVLEDAGFDAVLVENEYDRPHRVKAAAETIAAMTRATRAVVQERDRVAVGCEILLNDPQASLAVARMCHADFIRTDYFVDPMTRPEYGEFAIDADELIAYRAAIGANDILILADIQVKYAAMLQARPLSESARLACQKGADAIVVTGDASGDAPVALQLREAAKGAAGFEVPVLIGSGLDSENAVELLRHCDGAIVGTSLMKERRVDSQAACDLVASLGRIRA